MVFKFILQYLKRKHGRIKKFINVFHLSGKIPREVPISALSKAKSPDLFTYFYLKHHKKLYDHIIKYIT